jgi:alpha-1,3-mannosyl-glycoprotein beta-1,2-N-acetylglucosaminyltransferase
LAAAAAAPTFDYGGELGLQPAVAGIGATAGTTGGKKAAPSWCKVMAKRMRVYGIDTLRVAILCCIFIAVLLLCNTSLLQPSCQTERERAFRAEQLAYRLQAHAQPTDSTEKDSLRQRIAQLEKQLADERSQNPGGFQNALLQSLKEENRRLQGEISSLRAQLSNPMTGAPAAAAFLSRGRDIARGPLTEVRLKMLAAQDAIAVAVITCKRPKYLERAMTSFLKQRGTQGDKFPIIISQDGNDGAMTDLVTSRYVADGVAFHMRHEHDPSAPSIAQRFGKNALGYVRIAQHYGFAMRRLFDDFGFQQVIFLEEDMEVSPDFFSYFGAMLPILRQDPMLYCVSAWNDNGYSNLVMDPRAVYRTDFFPGLGWMLEKKVWNELRDRFAVAYWDEFMRRPDVRRNRHCIRPEVSRSYTFGEEGTSAGQFFKSHLSKIKINDENIDWGSENLQFLSSPEAFEQFLTTKLQQAQLVDLSDVDNRAHPGAILRIEYDDKRDYKRVAAKFSLMPDEKEGIRRMSYRGVIPFAWSGGRVFLHTGSWPDRVSLNR